MHLLLKLPATVSSLTPFCEQVTESVWYLGLKLLVTG